MTFYKFRNSYLYFVSEPPTPSSPPPHPLPLPRTTFTHITHTTPLSHQIAIEECEGGVWGCEWVKVVGVSGVWVGSNLHHKGSQKLQTNTHYNTQSENPNNNSIQSTVQAIAVQTNKQKASVLLLFFVTLLRLIVAHVCVTELESVVVLYHVRTSSCSEVTCENENVNDGWVEICFLSSTHT